jgi:hypothetical protein
MLINLRCDSKSPFLPEFKIPIFVNVFDKEKSRNLSKFILDKEKWILENIEPYPAEEDKTWLTNRLHGYNLFNFSDECSSLNDLKEFIRMSFINYRDSVGAPKEKTYIQCWANVLRNNSRGFTEHSHSDGHADSPHEYAYVSGTMCLSNLNTSTDFRNPFLIKYFHHIKNHVGENILFPSWVTHKSDANTTPIPRISIAYDIVTQEQLDLAQIEKRKNNFILFTE